MLYIGTVNSLGGRENWWSLLRRLEIQEIIVGDCLTCQGSFNPHSDMKLKRKHKHRGKNSAKWHQAFLLSTRLAGNVIWQQI